MNTVGIIANPSAGKDIRRLVASGRVVTDQEKANVITRICAGLVAMNVERVLVMPEPVGLARLAKEHHGNALKIEYIDMPQSSTGVHTTIAAAELSGANVDCIITLGGDGTNRVVAKGSGKVPLVAISTGTNNVFPEMIEGTLAGLAAGALSVGRVSREEVCTQAKRLEIFVDGELREIALIDAAVSSEIFAGARAIWNLKTISEIFLTRAETNAIGISAIGAQLHPVNAYDSFGLHITLGDDDAQTKILAPVGPGQVQKIPVSTWSLIEPDEPRGVELRPGMLALDGEREVSLLPESTVQLSLSLNGPIVVDISTTLVKIAGQKNLSK